MYKPIRKADLIIGGTAVKQGEIFTLGFQLFDANGLVIVPTVGQTISVKVANKTGVVFETVASVVGDHIEFTIDENIGAGKMRVELTVADGVNVLQKYPANGYIELYITASLDDIGTGTIYTVTAAEMFTRIEGSEEASASAVQTAGEAVVIAESAVETADAVRADFDLVVAEAGSSNPEVVLARGEFTTLEGRLDDANQQLAEKATKTELANVLDGSPKGTYATLAALQAAYPTGTTGVFIVTADGHIYSWSGSAWVDRGLYQAIGLATGSVTPSTVATSTYAEITRKDNDFELLKNKHGQMLNKFIGIKDGTFNVTGQNLDKFTQSFIDNDSSVPYLTTTVKKFMRLSFNNATGSKSSSTWGKKNPVTDITKPMINGYWIRKSDVANLGLARLSPLVWFYDSSNVLIDYISNSGITNSPTVVILGYKQTTTKNGRTLTFEVKDEYGDWFYCTQTVNLLPANTATVDFSFWLQEIPATTSGKVDILNFTVLEGSDVILPYFVYPETVGEKVKLATETSKDIKTINDTISAMQPASKKAFNFGYNLDNSLLKYRSALAKRATQVVKIACIGDSITEGYWSGLNHDRAYPVQLRRLMQAKYGGQDEGFVTVNDLDRWAKIGTGWILNGQKGMAVAQRSSAVAGDKLTFTFTGVAVDIIYSKNTDGGSCVVKIDGVDKTVLNCNGASEVYSYSQSYTGLTTGAHTLEIFAPTDGTKVYVEGAYVKTVGDTAGIRVDRRGRSGSFTGDWIASKQLDTFTAQPADLFIIGLGINDIGGSQTISAFKGRMQTIITKAKSVGSVIIVPMMQADPVADTRFAAWSEWVKVYYELADENNIGLIDVYELFGKGYQPAQQYGLFGINGGNGEGTDPIHPSARGQQLIADAGFKLIG